MRYLTYQKAFLTEYIKNGGFATRAFKAVVDSAETLPENTLRARASDLLQHPKTQKTLKARLTRKIDNDARVPMRLLHKAGLIGYALKAWDIADAFSLYERKQRENAEPNF